MKKSKIALLVLLMAVFTVFSADAKFGFGPKVGMNIDKLHLSGGNFDTENRCGFTGGLTAEYILPVVSFGVDISLMYSHMKNEVVDGETGEGYNVSGNFFEIPLHLKYMIGIPAVQSFIQPYVFTGPSVAFKLGGDDNFASTKSTQWGWDLGLGLQLISHLQVGAGYTFGINKIANWLGDNHAGHNVKVRNNYWTVTAAWMF